MQSYRHSGAIPLGAGLLMVILGLLAAVLGGVIYSYLFQWIPIVYLNILLTLVLGGVLGGTVGAVAHAGKVRNTSITTIIALGIALVGLYVEWGATVLQLTDYELGISSFQPLVIAEVAVILYKDGTWGLRDGAPMTGIPLAIIWILEAGMILGTAVIAARSFVANATFCETCYQWTERETGINYLMGTGNEHQVERATRGDLQALNELPKADSGDPVVLRIDIDACASCDRTTYFSLHAVTNRVDSKGNNKQTSNELVRHFAIPRTAVDYLAKCGQGNQPPYDLLPDEPAGGPINPDLPPFEQR